MTLFNSATVQTFEDALDSFRTLGKRSILALLGIVIGSASIVAVINIGHNAKQDAVRIFQDMGVGTLVVRLTDNEGAHTSPLFSDVSKIRALDFPDLLMAPLAVFSANVGFNQHATNAHVVGTDPPVFDVMKLSLSQGRFLHPFDQDENVVVLGHTIAESLGHAATRVQAGDWLKIKNYLFKVVGVLQPQIESLLSPIAVNDSVFVPIHTLTRVANAPQIDTIAIRLSAYSHSETIAAQLLDVLTHVLKPRVVQIVVPQQIIDGMTRQNHTFHYLLMALGAITLVGGGVAVMNVMYMNVSERRTEIGLRMAIGARRQDIRNLFLIEAITMSMLGAVLGACLGMALAYFYARISDWAFDMAVHAVPLGITCTVLTGIFFGLKPALAASRLTPVEALRDD